MKKIIHKFLRKHGLDFSIDFASGTRPAIAFVKMLMENKKLIGVEIGSDRGGNAKDILNKLNIEKLYLIDPYEDYEDYDELCNKVHKRGESEEIIRKELKKELKEGKVIIIKKYSSDAIKDIPNNLDFVYMDANHKYEYVLKDLEDYYPKVRGGDIVWT